MLIYKSIILLPVSEFIRRADFIMHSTWQTESVYGRKCRVVSWYKHEHVEVAGMKRHWYKQLTVAHVCMGCGKQMIIS